MLDEVEITLAACSEINMDRLLHAVSKGGLNDRLDRRKAGTASDAQHRAGMILAQIGGTKGKFEFNFVTGLQRAVYVFGRNTSCDAANVKFQTALTYTVGHGIAAHRSSGKSDLGILSGGKRQRRAICRRNSYQFDVVREVI